MNTETYTATQLFAHKMHDRHNCWFTAAGGNGYRLYTGTVDALTSVGFFRTQSELFNAAAEVNA